MLEYVTREAATQAAVRAAWLGQTSTDQIAKAINDIPAADVAPVVHARWQMRRSSWYCTNCGRGYRIIYGSVPASQHNYCPNCGAKMDGGNAPAEPKEIK